MSGENESIYIYGFCNFAIVELIMKVCKLINKMSKQIGISFTFLALIMKYRAPKNALPASTIAGKTLAVSSVALPALGSPIINKHPTNASETPSISYLDGLVPTKAPIKTIKSP